MKRPSARTIIAACAILAAPVSTHADLLKDIAQAVVDNASSGYQSPQGYSGPGGYYPYTPPPAGASLTARNQHTNDVGYRVGQDDFHHHLGKHFSRHPDLFDKETHDSFASGYERGYDFARSESERAARRSYQPPRASSSHVRSDLYPSGYYPYSPPPKDAEPKERVRHAYDVGYRVGQDDFNHGHSKHYTRHKDLYDKKTARNFAMGYEHGYDKARSHSTPPPAANGGGGGRIGAEVGQGRLTVTRGGRKLSIVRTAAPNIEKYHLTNRDRQIVVKSRGNHGPATVELFDIQTGTLRDKILAYAIKNGRPEWARGMQD